MSSIAIFKEACRKSRLYHMHPCSFIRTAVSCQFWTLLFVHTPRIWLHHPEIMSLSCLNSVVKEHENGQVQDLGQLGVTTNLIPS